MSQSAGVRVAGLGAIAVVLLLLLLRRVLVRLAVDAVLLALVVRRVLVDLPHLQVVDLLHH